MAKSNQNRRGKRTGKRSPPRKGAKSPAVDKNQPTLPFPRQAKLKTPSSAQRSTDPPSPPASVKTVTPTTQAFQPSSLLTNLNATASSPSPTQSPVRPKTKPSQATSLLTSPPTSLAGQTVATGDSFEEPVDDRKPAAKPPKLKNPPGPSGTLTVPPLPSLLQLGLDRQCPSEIRSRFHRSNLS